MVVSDFNDYLLRFTCQSGHTTSLDTSHDEMEDPLDGWYLAIPYDCPPTTTLHPMNPLPHCSSGSHYCYYYSPHPQNCFFEWSVSKSSPVLRVQVFCCLEPKTILSNTVTSSQFARLVEFIWYRLFNSPYYYINDQVKHFQ